MIQIILTKDSKNIYNKKCLRPKKIYILFIVLNYKLISYKATIMLLYKQKRFTIN